MHDKNGLKFLNCRARPLWVTHAHDLSGNTHERFCCESMPLHTYSKALLTQLPTSLSWSNHQSAEYWTTNLLKSWLDGLQHNHVNQPVSNKLFHLFSSLSMRCRHHNLLLQAMVSEYRSCALWQTQNLEAEYWMILAKDTTLGIFSGCPCRIS